MYSLNEFYTYNIDRKVKDSKNDRHHKMGDFEGALLIMWKHKRAIGDADNILYLDMVGGFTDVYIFTLSYKHNFCTSVYTHLSWLKKKIIGFASNFITLFRVVIFKSL